MLRKTTLREIKQSFSRWIAILSIVALGVGFFVGLKVCREAFWLTGDEYFLARNLFDFELISTLGIEQKHVEEIESIEGVEYAEGSYSTDALFTMEGDGESTGKFHMITEKINLPDVKEGRMPQSPDECLVDANRCGSSAIGQKIVISEGNDEDTIKMFREKSYTVVGRAESPLYLNYERGSTSLGDGTVGCFVYIPEDGWDSEVYTEMYVTLEEKYDIYSEEYDDLIDRYEDRITDAFDVTAVSRYEEIRKEAYEKLDDAQKKLDDGKEELEDAKRELADGKRELADGKRELTDAKKKLADGRSELDSGKKKLSEGREELKKNQKKLDDAEKEISENREKLDDAEKEALDGRQALEAGYPMIRAAYEELDAKEAALEMSAAYMTEEQLMQAKAQLAEARSEIDARYEAYEAGMAEIEKAEEEIAQGREELKAAKAELEDGKEKLKEGEQTLRDSEKEIADAEKKIADGEREVSDGEKEIADAEKKIADGEKEIAEGEEELRKNEKKLKKARRDVEKIEDPDTYILGRDTNIGYVCFESDTKIVEGISKVFPAFFFLVAALVVMTTMTRMIAEQRTQIGVLKALGYSSRRIMGKYIFYSASAGTIGGLLGFIVGSFLFPWVIWIAYGMMYGFSDLHFVLNWPLGLISTLAALLCAVGSTLTSCYSELHEAPAELIRPKAPAAGKRILLERIRFLWNRMPFLHKVSARNILRYKKRFFMMVLGISGCTALLVTGLGISDSIKNVVGAQYDNVFKADFTVTFDHAPDAAERVEFLKENKEFAEDALFLYTASMDAHREGQTKSVNLVVLDTEEKIPDLNKFVDLHTDEGEPIPYPGKGECVINSNLGVRLDLEPGDTITLVDSDMNEISAVIAAECENFVYNYMYVNLETYRENMGKACAMDSAYVTGYEGKDPNEAGAGIMNAENVSGVTVTNDFRERVDNMMKALDYVILLVVASAGALAFIVLYNLTNINITERIREIATIKVLGFYPNETAQYVFRENIVLTAISAVAGLPLGIALHRFVMSQVVVDLISFDIHIEKLSFLIAVILTFAFAFLVNFFMIFKLQKINMAESLKSIE